MKRFVVLILSMVFMVCGTSYADLDDGLVAYYPFNGNALNKIPNVGYDGDPRGVQFVEGKEGQAASFDGIDDYIHFEDGNPVFGSDDFSISVWFKVDQVPPTDGHIIFYLGRNKVGTIANEETFCITIGEFSSTLWVHVRDVYQHNSYTPFNTDIALGEWHHVVAVVTKTNLTVYLDGNEGVTVPVEDDYDLTSPDFDYMRIGAMTYGDGTRCLFKGLIDEVKIYNRALSTGAIQEGHNYGLFIGSHKPFSIEKGGYLPNKPHADAECLMNALNRYMRFSVVDEVNLVMKLEYKDNENFEKVRAAIEKIGDGMTSKDTFLFYYSGHGATGTYEIPNVQALSVGHDEQIWDSELEVWLDTYMPSQSKKITILDTCYSGGFWPDALENVQNTALMASATEDNFSYRHPVTGRNLYSNKLIKGLEPIVAGGNVPSADGDENGLTFQELHDWAFDRLLREKQLFEGLDLPVSDLIMPEGSFPWDTVDANINGSNEIINDLIGLFTGNNSYPVADAGPDQMIGVTDCLATVQLTGAGSIDPDGDELTYSWTWDGGSTNGISPALELPLGVHTITLIVNDGIVDSEPDSVEITVLDNTLPDINLSVSPETLWPPNHKMVAITPTLTAVDNCDPNPVIELVSITMNEGETESTFDPNFDIDQGAGYTGDDIQIDGGNILLRAERAGKSDGRIYTITYKATDIWGNTSEASATVTVPHNQ